MWHSTPNLQVLVKSSATLTCITLLLYYMIHNPVVIDINDNVSDLKPIKFAFLWVFFIEMVFFFYCNLEFIDIISN